MTAAVRQAMREYGTPAAGNGPFFSRRPVNLSGCRNRGTAEGSNGRRPGYGSGAGKGFIRFAGIRIICGQCLSRRTVCPLKRLGHGTPDEKDGRRQDTGGSGRKIRTPGTIRIRRGRAEEKSGRHRRPALTPNVQTPPEGGNRERKRKRAETEYGRDGRKEREPPKGQQ